MADNKRKSSFSINFPENFKKDANLPSTQNISFDDLGDFIEEREKIKRLIERKINTELKIDYSNFENHVFFDSAYQKFNIAKDKILLKYPYNKSLEEKEAFFLSSSGYENYVFKNQWPKYVGYVEFNGTNQYISAQDTDNKLFIGSSSFYISSWIKPKITTENTILQIVSSSLDLSKSFGYHLYLSESSDPHIKFDFFSGSASVTLSSSYSSYLDSNFHNVAVLFDKAQNIVSLYVDKLKKVSSSVSFGSIEFNSARVLVGSSSFPGDALYSGSIDEVRVLHTASELFHFKNYSRNIDSENYVKLKYSFNEGITGFSSYDSIVVDYSPNSIHGTVNGYNSNFRVSGTALNSELGDAILYSVHPSVVAFTGSMIQSASLYDDNNPNLIFNQIGEYILKEDSNQSGLLTSFSLALARFFDELKSYVDQFENIKITNYEDKNETPDLMLPYLKRYFGWKATEHFNDSNPLEFFFGENILSSGSLEIPVVEIRNQFWRRILNNLPYLYATKGKRANIDSFFNVVRSKQREYFLERIWLFARRQLNRRKNP